MFIVLFVEVTSAGIATKSAADINRVKISDLSPYFGSSVHNKVRLQTFTSIMTG